MSECRIEPPSETARGPAPELRPCHNCLHLCLSGQFCCPECGVRQRSIDSDHGRAGVAGVLSFLIPGLGHFYLSRAVSGLMWALLAPTAWLCAYQRSKQGVWSFMLFQASTSRMLLGFVPLLYHALAAAHAIHLGQPRFESARARAARTWLLRIGTFMVGGMMAYTFAYPKVIVLWPAPPSPPKPAPSPTPAQPDFQVNFTAISENPSQAMRIDLTVANKSLSMVERGRLWVEGENFPAVSVDIGYLNPNQSRNASVVLEIPEGRLPKGLTLRIGDAVTPQGPKQFTVAGPNGFALLRLASATEIGNGRFLATFDLLNVSALPIPSESYCQLSLGDGGGKPRTSSEYLILPQVPAGGRATAQLPVNHTVNAFTVSKSLDHQADRTAQRLVFRYLRPEEVPALPGSTDAQPTTRPEN